MKNKVSIIIATYNRAHLILETLESVCNQTYTNWECIIVDDGSTDNTEKIVNDLVSNDSRFKFLNRPSERPKGPNAARNFGIENSTGEYVLSLDSDDWILPEHLELKVEVFKKDHTIDGVLSKTIMVDSNKVIIKKEERTRLTKNILEDFISLRVSWYMHDIMWRKSFFENKVLYDEQLLKMLDRDFHIRRLSEEPVLAFIDEYLSLYRIHENSNSSNNNINVAESRHNAIIKIVNELNGKGKLSNNIKFYLFKHQVQNLVILHKHPNCMSLYFRLIKKTFIFRFDYLKWLLKLMIGYCSFKIMGRGLYFVQ
ncbi:glycosyltransferase family 2 protein [Flavobacterium branchiarum]|uniref:Glycosyltransferase family 2 protein n=1 Tax=Flavobacterium branchiarum TaxID=1114870 RepID=A0ABV5FNQ2_9FLAO|nr:glycosyltransferase family 2 protein [Flavobacterium branchiarum]MDN3671940.1 glycosyltransferase family 2 protein [Flavobacterium branchiarum]